MAVRLILSAVLAAVIYQIAARYLKIRRQLAEAKSSGLPIVVLPWNVYSVFWLASYYIWLPWIKKLPFAKGLWLDLLDPEWAYRIGHRPFAQLGSDVFIVVSPKNRVQCYVADAEVITQVTTRRNDFPKPLEMYGRLDIYGKNLVSTEGGDWRLHRKLTAPSFGQKNNELVFIESIHHTNSMLRLWTGPDGQGNQTIVDPALDTMRFALFVISRAGFDVRVSWPHEEAEQPAEEEPQSEGFYAGSKPPPGHEMNYRQALSSLLENIMWTQIGPPEYLTKSPFKVHREVGKAVIEWGKYMDELYETKKREVTSGHSGEGMDLFQAMIKGSGVLDEGKKAELQKSDVLGNAFVIMLAGHETTANTIHFSLVYLAMHWQSQKRLQEDIDKVLQGRSADQMTYEEDFPKLFNGMAAAVMNETLRLLQPIINIPKSTPVGRPQMVTMNGQQRIIPGGAQVSLSSAIHRNPKYWPAPADDKSIDGRPDVDRFRPERWLANAKSAEEFVDINYDDEELRGPSGEDTSAHLFKPVKGSYIPFSDGFRSCIGRRFAQVEVLACLAVIFSQYSIELAVDEFATDTEVEKMPLGGKERKAVWQTAADRADALLTTALGSVITLQLRGSSIPLRVVKRGEEQFAFG